MASTFTFGFSGDDIDAGEENGDGDVEMEVEVDFPTGESVQTRDHAELVPAQKHDLADLLSTLPSALSYNTLSVPIYPLSSITVSAQNQLRTSAAASSSSIPIHRRSLFDVLIQLKAEAEIHLQPATHDSDRDRNRDSQSTTQVPGVQTNGSEYDDLISGLERGDDLRSGVYEGGFKTWECGVDLASYLGSFLAVGGTGEGEWLDLLLEINGAYRGDDQDDSGVDLDITELGAGSGIPSLVLLKHILSHRLKHRHENQNGNAQEMRSRRSKRIGHVRFILCDYNIQVLKLVTVANVLQIAAATTKMSSGSIPEQEEVSDGDGDLHDITSDLHQQILSTLDEADIEITFLSGAWGPRFVEMLSRPPLNPRRASLVLASETLYSPSSLIPFTDTLLALLRQYGSGCGSMALVASKKMYFGVGGGVDEFVNEVRTRGGDVKVVKEIRDSNDGGGVGRVVLRVTTN